MRKVEDIWTWERLLGAPRLIGLLQEQELASARPVTLALGQARDGPKGVWSTNPFMACPLTFSL